MLCFPIKSEICQNFRVHAAGLVSVNCRKMVLFGPNCSGWGHDGGQDGTTTKSVTDYQAKPKKTPKSNSKKRERLSEHRKTKNKKKRKATQKDKNDGLPMKMKSKVTK